MSRLGIFRFCGVFALAFAATACSGGNSEPYGPDEDGDGWPSRLDCDDTNKKIFPSADEIPDDGIDQDCSGRDEETLGLGGAGGQVCVGAKCGSGGGAAALDSDEDGFTLASGDCDDDDPLIHPGAYDLPGDGIDQNCAGGDSTDGDADGYGVSDGDCDDSDPSIHPKKLEIILDGVDQNCDGSDLPSPSLVSPLSKEAVPAAAPAIAGGSWSGKPVMLLAWPDSRVAPAQDLYAQLVDADGKPLGSEIAVETSDNLAKTSVRVASKGDGFLVTWTTANGVFVRRLNADGSVNGITLGYGSSGAANPKPVFGGKNWIVVWSDTNNTKLLSRAMTTDGVRSDTIEDVVASLPEFSVVGKSDGALVVWNGALPGVETNGLTGQVLDAVAKPTKAPFAIVEGNFQSPTLASTMAGYELTYRVPGSLGFVASLPLDADFVAGSARRLSSESIQQTNFATGCDAVGCVAVWEDFRHSSGPMAVQAIYGSDWLGSSVRVPQSYGVDAAASLSLGGLAFAGDQVWVSRVGADGASLIRLR